MSSPTIPTQASEITETVDPKKKEYTINPVCYFSKGNVHFITSDNVLFSFDLKRLAVVSSFFKDLVDIPRALAKKTAAPVSSQTLLDTLTQLSLEEQEDLGELIDALVVYPECSSKALQPWLNLVFRASDTYGLALNIALEDCIYSLMDRYGCVDSLVESLRSQLFFMEKDRELFITGSQVNDKILGKMVLELMAYNTFLTTGFRAKMDRLSEAWQLPMYKAFFGRD
ncbi:hypothetical protein IAR50_007303 [Cryptococcus sp. DSM 104548]